MTLCTIESMTREDCNRAPFSGGGDMEWCMIAPWPHRRNFTTSIYKTPINLPDQDAVVLAFPSRRANRGDSRKDICATGSLGELTGNAAKQPDDVDFSLIRL